MTVKRIDGVKVVFDRQKDNFCKKKASGGVPLPEHFLKGVTGVMYGS